MCADLLIACAGIDDILYTISLSLSLSLPAPSLYMSNWIYIINQNCLSMCISSDIFSKSTWTNSLISTAVCKGPTSRPVHSKFLFPILERNDGPWEGIRNHKPWPAPIISPWNQTRHVRLSPKYAWPFEQLWRLRCFPSPFCSCEAERPAEIAWWISPRTNSLCPGRWPTMCSPVPTAPVPKKKNSRMSGVRRKLQAATN